MNLGERGIPYRKVDPKRKIGKERKEGRKKKGQGGVQN